MLSAKKTLGILGGLGPMSSVYFYELITAHTRAMCDQDHLDIILVSRASTPDRTAYITGTSQENPLPAMTEEVCRLAGAGADIIALPCNTAHFIYDALSGASPVPVMNIIELTVEYAKFTGARRVGVMSTEGTYRSGVYQAACRQAGIGCIDCPPDDRATLTDIIYNSIKRGQPADLDSFERVAERLHRLGADRIILGCTELSLIKKEITLPDFYIDSLEVLAACAIFACGGRAVGFPRPLEEFAKLYRV
ncbi:MAG TPA: amino acid racemase [Bacillota bacterium]|nr:amino acid racemase [Bacillota bacterium]